MKTRIVSMFAVCCLVAVAVFAQTQDLGIAGDWATDEAAKVLAARAAPPARGATPAAADQNPPPAITMELKLDGKKTKVSGVITEVKRTLKYDIQDGKVSDKKFTFKTVDKIGNQTTTMNWAGELKDDNTITLARVPPNGDPMLFHRVAAAK